MKSPRPARWLVALLGIGGVLLAMSALAQDCPELVGRVHGGTARALAVAGDLAFLAGGHELLIADVSDPLTPRVVGDVWITAQDVAVSGDYAYVASGGLAVIDVSTPSAPVEVGFYDLPDYDYPIDVAVSDGYAYIVTNTARLRVIDVSVPSAPVEVGFIDTPDFTNGVAVSGGYAYVAWGNWQDRVGGLRVIDVSTPSAPVEVGFVDTPGNALDVAVEGRYVYVADGESGGLRVIDVRTPSAPVEVGFLDTPGFAAGVAVAGGYAYVASEGGPAGLHVIDVRAPSAPVEVGFYDLPDYDHPIDVAVSDGYAYLTSYVGDQRGGFHVFDVATPSEPTELGSFNTIDRVANVAVSGDYAYVGTSGGDPHWSSALHVLDVSTPHTPVAMGIPLGGEIAEIADIAVGGGYAYVADYNSGLVVYDVSNPSAPEWVGGVYYYPGGEGFAGVAVSGGYAYLAARSAGLRVIDVSVPSAPVEVGLADIPGDPTDVAVAGGYAYVVGWETGFRVIDVTDPSTPIEVGSLDTEGKGVAMLDGYAYVVAWGGGLRVINVSTPSAPVEVGFVDIPGDGVGVAVSDGYAYVAWTDYSGEGGLQVVDVSTPSAPVEVGFHGMRAWFGDDTDVVAVSRGYVYVASGLGGLYIFRDCTEGPRPDARECFIPAAAVAAGAEGAFFQTDLELNNTGSEDAEVSLRWLPRGEDNTDPVTSEQITLAAGHTLRYENVLTELFGLEPDSVGALKMTATTESVIGMSRTYNIPGAKAAGTFGQGLPAIRATDMITGTAPQRILFLSENDDFRANVGCVNGTDEDLTVSVGIYDDEGSLLETRTMGLGPYANDQLNRIFEDYAPVNGYVDVWADRDDAIYYCYGSMLDNLTSDPTTILPQVPSDDTIFIPAAALAAGAEGSFFTTDLDLNNAGSTDLTYELLWLPRGEDNSEPTRSDTFSLAAGTGVRYGDVLGSIFGLEPDEVGALSIEASGTDLLAMSRTYNTPSASGAGTFGQGLAGIAADRMIPTGVTKRILFLSDNDDVRSNVGCINGAGFEVAVAIDLYDSDGAKLETKYMMLPPYSYRQINGIFQDYAPINGYVDVRTYTSGASIYCYGSVLDNVTSDPTTVLPQ